jgi:transposase
MRTVDDFARIRQAHRDGLSARQIASQLGVGRDTVRKALQNPEPQPYTLAQPRAAPVFGPFREIVEAILQADESAPPKQRHTASQVYRRLVAEYGYAGGYDQVRRHLQERRRSRRETFIPLGHPPGHRAEADFGHIAVDFPDGRWQVPVLVVTWSYSNCPFAVALPTERTEAILHGLAEAFAFFGCVPKERGGTTRGRSPSTCSAGATARCTRGTRPRPRTTPSPPSSACRPRRRRSRGWRSGCRTCSGSGPRPCRRSATWPS